MTALGFLLPLQSLADTVQDSADQEQTHDTVAQPADDQEKGAEKGLQITIHPPNRRNDAEAPLGRDKRQSEPVSATVYDAQTITDANLDTVTEALELAPGVNSTSLAAGSELTSISVRGATDFSPFTTAEHPVGFVVDDVYIANENGFDLRLFDAARVEILRGPQGTRGGHNAIAGVVRVESQPPTEATTAHLTASVGNLDYRQVTGVVNTPVVRNKAYQRFVFNYTKRDGFARNLAGGRDVGELDDWGLREHVSAALAPNLIGDLSFDFAKFSPLTGAIAPFDTIGDREVNIVQPPDVDRQIYGGALRLKWLGNGDTLTSITALRGFDSRNMFSNFNGLDLVRYKLGDDQWQTSEELKIKGSAESILDWTGGLFVFYEHLDKTGIDRLTGAASILGLPSGHEETSQADQGSWQAAIYGDATWHLTGRLSLFGGVRLTYDRKKIDFFHTANDGIGALAPVQSVDDRATDFNVSPRVGLQYELVPDVRAYGLVSRGYKAGGFNTLIPQTSDIDFEAEQATNFEVGLKSRLLQGRLVANASAYWFEWENQQVQSPTFGFPTTNADRSRIRGLELTLAARPTPGLDIVLGGALTDARYADFKNYPAPPASTPSDISGNRLPITSKWSTSIAVQYVHPLNDTIDLFARSDYSYRSSQFFDPSNHLKQPGYGLLSARIGLEGKSWGVYLWGRNLTDQAYRVFGLNDAIDGTLALIGEPRTFGAEGRIRI